MAGNSQEILIQRNYYVVTRLLRGQLLLKESIAVTESVHRDLNRVSVWCDLWEMKSNEGKTKTMIVSRSLTVHPQLTPLILSGTVLQESADLVI